MICAIIRRIPTGKGDPYVPKDKKARPRPRADPRGAAGADRVRRVCARHLHERKDDNRACAARAAHLCRAARDLARRLPGCARAAVRPKSGCARFRARLSAEKRPDPDDQPQQSLRVEDRAAAAAVGRALGLPRIQREHHRPCRLRADVPVDGDDLPHRRHIEGSALDVPVCRAEPVQRPRQRQQVVAHLRGRADARP